MNDDKLELGKGFELETKDGSKIISAPCEKVSMYKEQVERILWALGHPEAWVSDESDCESLGDDATLFEASNTLGMVLEPDMKIVDAAKQLAAKEYPVEEILPPPV